MLTAVVAIFLLAALAPAIHCLLPRHSHWLLALGPAVLAGWFAGFLQDVGMGGVLAQTVPWAPAIGVDLSFRLDGLSLLFALLILGIGTFILIYTGGYLHGHEHQGRFYLFILAFMGAMLGLVLADDVAGLFVFWELTSITSFLLIGFHHADARARRSAMQALLVTAMGGLALLAGLILMGIAGGSFRLSALAAGGIDLREHALYLPILTLVLIGAFTKSAQVPFHFWLPNAMDAPTPVSAYLHSATMVKAGVYLLARLNPHLGGTEIWFLILGGFGSATALWGGLMVLRSTDLKRVLAYSTLMTLGALTALIGLGTPYALRAYAVFLLAHSLYKGALFMGAGAIDHGTGIRDVRQLSGLWPRMRLTGLFVLLASLSMAGLPPFFGFLGKELMYEGMLEAGPFGTLVLACMIAANATMLAAAGLVFVKPFLGAPGVHTHDAHEGAPALWLGPAVLASLGLLFGLWGDLPAGLLDAVTGAVAGTPLGLDLRLWHGLTPALGLSALTVALGVGLHLGRDRAGRILAASARTSRIDVDAAYDRILLGLDRLALNVTGRMQAGRLRGYLFIMFLFAVGLTGTTLILRGPGIDRVEPVNATYIGGSLSGLMLLGTGAAIAARSRLAAILALSVVGLSVALFFLAYGAADVAITQLMVETLVVIIVVLVLARLPFFASFERPAKADRLRDGALALAIGGIATALLLALGRIDPPSDLSDYFVAQSYVAAHGRNVVNVILVDFRGFDTLGEVTVLAVAGLGVLALLKARQGARQGERHGRAPTGQASDGVPSQDRREEARTP